MRQQWAMPCRGGQGPHVCAASRQARQAAGGATEARRLALGTHEEDCSVEGAQDVVQVLLRPAAAEDTCVLSMAPTGDTGARAGHA